MVHRVRNNYGMMRLHYLKIVLQLFGYHLLIFCQGAPGYGNLGGKTVQHLKCNYPNGSEVMIKFEFRSTNANSSEDIGGGQIDEFSFKLIEN